MEHDKIDESVVKLMTDEELQKYLIAPGVRNFCDKTDVETKQKVSLVEQLREKIEAHKAKRMQVGNAKAGHQSRKELSEIRVKSGRFRKCDRKVKLSWKHVSNGSSRQIRLEHGGGTRDVLLNLSDKKCHIIQIAKEEFFKNGTSSLGEMNDFVFDIWDSTLSVMSEEETVKDVLERLHVSMPRFHFVSKRKIISRAIDSSDDSIEGKVNVDQQDDAITMNQLNAETDIKSTVPTACTVAHSCTQVILCEASGGRSKYQCVECYAAIVVEDDENTISELPKIENSWTAAGTPTVQFRQQAQAPGKQSAETSHSSVTNEVISSKTVSRQPSRTISRAPASDEDASLPDLPCTDTYNHYVDVIKIDDDADYISSGDDNEDFQQLLFNSICTSGAIEPKNDKLKEDIRKQVIKKLCSTITGDSIPILVQRRRILKSTGFCTSAQKFDFDRPVKITFSGEEAIDDGGPTREFFRLLMKEVITSMGVLTGSDVNKIFAYSLENIRLNKYKTAGKYVRWSVYHGGPGIPVLNRYMFQLMVHEGKVPSCDFQDAIDSVDDVNDRNNLYKIFNCKTDEECTDISTVLMDWLCDNGISKVRFVMKDRISLVADILKHLHYYRILPSIQQFLSGLGDLWTNVLKERDVLDELFIAVNQKLDFNSFRQLYQIDYSPIGSNNKVKEDDSIYVWECFLTNCAEGNSKVTLEMLLEFWTGADVVPPGGFEQQLNISFFTPEVSVRRLPTAHTCACMLLLPRGIEDPEMLSDLMETAVLGCQGFGII